MGSVHHGSAAATASVRQAMQNSQESLRRLAKRCGIPLKTAAKRKKRTSTADLPTGPKEPRSTAPSLEEEAIAVAFRRCRSTIVCMRCSQRFRIRRARPCIAV